MWTIERVAEHVRTTAPADWDFESDDEVAARWVRPITDFGLYFRADPVEWQDHLWKPEYMPIETVDLSRVKSSTQHEGVLVDVIHHYLENPCELYDPDGWFDNKLPVFILRLDGTYTVRDGNHRTVAAKLRGDTHIQAHVVI